MLTVLIVSAEARLIEAVQANLGKSVQIRTAASAEEAQNVVFQETVRLVFLDYALVKDASADPLVGIDNIVQKESGLAVLLCRRATPEAVKFRDQFRSIRIGIDLSRGRDQFDEKIAAAVKQVRVETDLSVSTDRLLRYEVDLPAPEAGSLVDFPLARLLYTVWQRRETGVLTLGYASHELSFAFNQGELITSPQHAIAADLLGAFAWSHGTYAFNGESVAGPALPILPLIAEGCRDHIRQRAITEMMTPVMRRYPVKTNLWSERADPLSNYAILTRLMESLDGETNWEDALSALGQNVSDGFRAAYFAQQIDLVHVVSQPGLIGVAVQYSRSVRRARQAVDRAEVEQTKAFKASGSGRSEVERELGVRLGRMRDMSPHEVFGVWEGCGRKVVQDRFYILVKEHHPDVYGGNTSGNVRQLAQDIFIRVKDAYQELLSEEKEQTVAPPTAAPNRQHVPARPRLDTPRIDAAIGPEPSEVEEDPQIDVKAKLAQMSGFRKKQRHRERLRSFQGRTETPADTSADRPRIVTPAPEPEPEPEPEPDPEELRANERQAKLNHLLRRAQEAGHPDANPARDSWDEGFHAYKEGRNPAALQAFKRAYDLEPDNGAYITFYAYLLFVNDPAKAAEAEELLRKALQTGDRQAAPDACLFLAHTIKAQEREDEALTFYKRALRLNPSSREAEREVRLAEMRNPKRKGTDSGALFKNLFKK